MGKSASVVSTCSTASPTLSQTRRSSTCSSVTPSVSTRSSMSSVYSTRSSVSSIFLKDNLPNFSTNRDEWFSYWDDPENGGNGSERLSQKQVVRALNATFCE